MRKRETERTIDSGRGEEKEEHGAFPTPRKSQRVGKGRDTEAERVQERRGGRLVLLYLPYTWHLASVCDDITGC